MQFLTQHFNSLLRITDYSKLKSKCARHLYSYIIYIYIYIYNIKFCTHFFKLKFAYCNL